MAVGVHKLTVFSMQKNAVLGVDTFKKKVDVCLVVNGKRRHRAFKNDQEGFSELMSWCNEYGAKQIHLCLDATNWRCEDLAYFMYELGHSVSMVNPKEFDEYELPKSRKTYPLMIAKFCVANKPALWHPNVPDKFHRLRELCRCRDLLKADRAKLQSDLENKNTPLSCKRAISEVASEIETQIANLEREISEQARVENLLF